jgi:hypothetical protein
MKQYNSISNLELLNFDSISKFNLLNFNQILNISKLKIIIPISTGEPNFLKNYIILTKIFKELFNRKIYVFNVKKKFMRGGKFRNNLIFYIGITLRKKEIFHNLNYLLNTIIPLTKKVNNNIILKKNYNNIFTIKFFNMNNLLGINSYAYYNLSLEFNYNINFNSINNYIKLNKFYEKFFL